jgi:hypothetical protein
VGEKAGKGLRDKKMLFCVGCLIGLVLLHVDVDLNMRTEFVLPCLSRLYDAPNVTYFYDIFFLWLF